MRDFSRVRFRDHKTDFAETPIRRYTLKADLTAGGHADAVFCEWDNLQREFVDTTEEFQLYSFGSTSGTSGDRGYCIYRTDHRNNPDGQTGNGVWEVIGGGGGTQVQWVTFYLPQALSGQLSVANCPVITDWYNNAGATSITVFNELGFTGDAGAEGYAAKVPATGRWVIIQLPCAAGTS